MNKVTSVIKGAAIVAGVAAAGAAMSHKPTREKVLKRVKKVSKQVQKTLDDAGEKAKEQYQAKMKQIEKKLPMENVKNIERQAKNTSSTPHKSSRKE